MTPSQSNESLLSRLVAFSKDQIQQAGQRYTPGIDPQAPNLRIESLVTAIENAACGAGALDRFKSFLKALSEAWDRAKYCSQRSRAIRDKIDSASAFVSPMIVRLRARDEGAGEEWSDRLSAIDVDLSADMEHWRTEAARLVPEGGDGGGSSARNTAQGNMNSIGQCLSVLRDELEYIRTSAFRTLFDPRILISGEWGTGKTHLLCDVTQSRIDLGQATLLALAKNFHGSVVEDICARIEAGLAADVVFERLAELSRGSGERALILIDGVNEGGRKEWREAIAAIQALIEHRPNLALVVTCRTPFEPVAIDAESLQKFNRITHRGFDDQEFDAQAAFFQYYKLPLPEVPLLDREFSRPLTLKLICQSLEDLSSSKFAKGFEGIASGQKGMTFVLESFAKRVGEPIESEYSLPGNACWRLLKGNDAVADARLSGFAPCMAANMRGYVLPAEADRIVSANFPALKPAQRKRLLEALRTSGLIEEDVVWRSTKSGVKSRIVFRLPYQRFSDHLIARHLLSSRYLDTASIDTIKQSFEAGSPLGRIFRISNRYQRGYAEPGWAQALITEFPERVKQRIPSKQRELIFMLPRRAQDLNAYFGPFIDGIFWRAPSAFTDGTNAIINQFLTGGTRMWEKTVDALAAVSTKPKHPYHARRLYDFLSRLAMPDRDLQWSEYLRRQYASPTIHRLLTWAGKFNAASMKLDSATELVVLLSLLLTTVVRKDRDLATKALVLIGEKFPEVLFAHVATSLEFNDPYVPERMLAAAYGTCLSLVDSNSAPQFLPVLGNLATTLYSKMFASGAGHSTHHTLMRDYALGIIQLAQRANCATLPEEASESLSAPFSNNASTFSSDGTPDPAIKTALGNAIQMDFGNYTMGRLIRNRANYDDSSPGYVQVRSKIERRMFDLGYRAERFQAADREIGGRSWNSSDQEKVDRYGKKYSWIAYFEMFGEQEAKRRLPDWRLGERSSDCGVDPSFPKRPPDWTPPIPDLFGSPGAGTEEWVQGGFTPEWDQLLVVPEINGYAGPWVLVEGYVNGVDEDGDRELFAFLRGMFVVRKDVSELETKFLSLDYPGNDKIPAGVEEHYLYAGEAGKRQNYVRSLLQRNGQYRRQVVETFGGYEPEEPNEANVASTGMEDVISTNADGTLTISLDLIARYPKMRHVPGVRVELPNVQFGWESYHSAYNDFSGFDLPAPSLIQRLGLRNRNREIDFCDSTGSPATLYRVGGSGWGGNQHKLLYVRADLLRNYLRDTRQVLVWCNWGERDWMKKMDGFNAIRDPARQKIYQAHDHIHRSFCQWSAKDSKVE
jgi:hypothetical protein